MGIINSNKNIVKSAIDKAPKNRKASITNVDNSKYCLDVDLNLPVGTVLIRDKSVMTPYAGDNYGFICSSREKQSVIIAPVDGNYDRGVILGRVFDNDKERIPYHNLGDTLFKHELGSQWSFRYTQPITGSMNLDFANSINLEEATIEANINGITFNNIKLDSGENLLIDNLVRVVLNYEDSQDTSKNLYVEWETRIEYNSSNKEFLIKISNNNTIVGQVEDYDNIKNRDFQAMLLSPPKGIAQFSHYMGMGLYMDEYPSRVPIGRDPVSGYPIIDKNGNIASLPLNSDSFLDDTIDEYGKLQNFPRGSLTLKHYSDSGLYMLEKARKTYSDLLDEDKMEWYQSAMGVNLVLIRPTPQFNTIRGMDDDERPMASLIMEDDCKNAMYNAMHIRLAHDLTGAQAVTKQEIEMFNIVHRDIDGNNDLVENALIGTRPSRLQFYDLKRTLNIDEIDNDDFKCIHNYNGICKLNLILDKDGTIEIEGKKYREVSKQEEQATYGSGKEDEKTGAKKCPCWPGCSEGHFTRPNLDIPLSVRNQDIWVNNMPLLIKPKANMELAHYTGSGLFIEEQLPYKDKDNIDYDLVPNYHSPNVLLRLREWNYNPFTDGSNVINYEKGNKNNSYEPKLYDSCILEFDTIYGDRKGKNGKGSYEFEDNGNITFYDEHESYKTANKITLAQKLYGNLLEDSKSIQLGNRLLFEDLLDDDGKPLGVWGLATSVENPDLEGTDEDTRILMPKGKLELMHYTNSGLLIEELDTSTVANDVTDYSTLGHKMSMSLLFNYWTLEFDGDKEYRPVDPKKHKLDPMGIMRWEETGNVKPKENTYLKESNSFIDFYIYQNVEREQYVTEGDNTINSKWKDKIEWWNGEEGSNTDKTPTGAYIAIRESANPQKDSNDFRNPVLDITDSINSIRMDSLEDNSKIEITNRAKQFTNDAPEVNKILMDSMNQIMQFINGYEGMAESGNNSITMNKKEKSITILDANENKITINSDGINIEDKNGNIVTLASSGINLEDKNGNIVTLASSGINLEDKNGNKVEMASGGIKVEASANVDVKGTNITVDGTNVKITGGMLTTNGTAAPSGTGPYCGIPLCIFSSAPHVGSIVSGT